MFFKQSDELFIRFAVVDDDRFPQIRLGEEELLLTLCGSVLPVVVESDLSHREHGIPSKIGDQKLKRFLDPPILPGRRPRTETGGEIDLFIPADQPDPLGKVISAEADIDSPIPELLHRGEQRGRIDSFLSDRKEMKVGVDKTVQRCFHTCVVSAPTRLCKEESAHRSKNDSAPKR